MKEEIKLANGIYDIVSPAEPALSTTDYAIIIILIAVFSAIVIYIASCFIDVDKIRVSRNIRRLKIAHSNKAITTRTAVYQLCSLVRDGLKIQTINPDDVLPEKITLHQSRWNNFASELSRLRYQKTDAQPVDVSNLFDESLFWLRIWP
jgi:hypothetical protein